MMAEFDASYIATLTFQLFYERTKIFIVCLEKLALSCFLLDRLTCLARLPELALVSARELGQGTQLGCFIRPGKTKPTFSGGSLLLLKIWV